MTIPQNLLNLFWSRVDKSGDCWEWTGSKNKAGYGTFSGVGDLKTAHRASYYIAHGEVPAGAFVCHHCDNRACVRPDHLYAGNALSNSWDRIARGRSNSRSGELHPSRFYLHPVHRTPEALASMTLWRTTREQLGMTQEDLAHAIGCALMTVSNAERGAHVPKADLLVRLDRLARSKLGDCSHSQDT